MRNKKNLNYMIAAVAVIALLLGLDQWTKDLAVTYLKAQPNIVLIKGVLELAYLENRGAAFGLFQNQQWLFFALTFAFLAFSCRLLWKVPKTRHFLPLYWVFVILTAGALGNFIDRLSQTYVVDFLYFSLIDFPVFNLADIYVSLSAAAFFILMIFIYKEEDYGVFFKKKGKK